MSKEQKITTDIKVPNKDLEALRINFPHCFDKDGNFQLEKFKANLTEKEINFSTESYGLDWLGKSYARLLASDPATTLLKADETHNSKPENANSENLLIKGDNLEVLKHLANAYYEQVKMIYIDPPYNTGKDFVYSDKFQMSEEELADEMNLRDEDGLQRVGLTKNEKSSARYHSDWLNMMYPRLVLARNLLKDSGVIFISIDDNEQANLKAICDEIFGEENIVQTIAWRRSDNQPNIGISARVKEYIYVYSKSYRNVKYGRLPLSEVAKKEYNYEDKFGKCGRGILRDEVRGRFDYEIVSPKGKN